MGSFLSRVFTNIAITIQPDEIKNAVLMALKDKEAKDIEQKKKKQAIAARKFIRRLSR